MLKSWRIWRCVAVALVAGGIVGVLYWFPPAETGWMPKCPMKLCTGWDCPACGFQRATHALLHGNVAEALAYNYFFVISIPYFVAVVIGKWGVKGKLQWHWQRIVEHRYAVSAYIVLFMLWWVVRNIWGL